MSSVSRLLKGLNPEQKAAVCQTEGPVLLLAGAGSGKTRVIITRIAYLIAEGLADPEDILAVTFTNKAASEMRARVANILGEGCAREIHLSTFHSFCLQVLRTEIEHVGYRRNFTVSTESDARTLVRRSLEDIEGVNERFDLGEFMGRIGMMKSRGLEPGAVPEKKSPKRPKKKAEQEKTAEKYTQWLPEVYDRYQSALRAANTVDFDDLLLLTLQLWRGHSRIRGRYRKRFKYVMVDEYQDTNRVQYELLMELVGKHRNLCVVGDDDQSIYSWRGADIGNILSFERDFPEAKVIKLEQNYRSTKTILEAANSVIAHNKARREKKLWSKLGKGRHIDRIITGDEEHEAREAASWLKHIRSRSGARYRDFAVLYRSNQQSRPFEIAFRNASIPYVVIGGQEFYERTEIKDLVAYLKILVNPRDEASFLRIVNVPRRGIGDATLHQVHAICRTESLSLGKGFETILKRGGLNANTEAGIRHFLGLVKDFRARFRGCDGNLKEVVTELVDAVGYWDDLKRITSTPEQFAARWANVEALLEAVGQYEAEQRKAGQTPMLSGFLDASALVGNDEGRSKEERRESGVTLMTVHSAKGLEFPFVFIVGAEEGLMPHARSLEEGTLEEERRLFYVALTRARKHATLFEALSRNRFGRTAATKPSRFANEIPEALLKEHVRAARDMVEEHVQAETKKPAKAKRTKRAGKKKRA